MIPVPSRIFREYDIRGEAESDLTDENVLAIARAYGTYLKRSGILKATVGGDVRLSTGRIRAATVGAPAASTSSTSARSRPPCSTGVFSASASTAVS